MFSVCKVRYSDPSSWRWKTVDAAIWKMGKRPGLILYSVVFERGLFLRAQIYPCYSGKISAESIQEQLRRGMEELEESVEVLCVDELERRAMLVSVEEDFAETAPDDLSYVLTVIDNCFGKDKGGKL